MTNSEFQTLFPDSASWHEAKSIITKAIDALLDAADDEDEEVSAWALHRMEMIIEILAEEIQNG